MAFMPTDGEKIKFLSSNQTYTEHKRVMKFNEREKKNLMNLPRFDFFVLSMFSFYANQSQFSFSNNQYKKVTNQIYT